MSGVSFSPIMFSVVARNISLVAQYQLVPGTDSSQIQYAEWLPSKSN